ncbi:DUF4232 domain-containing protein [Streptomyces sp. NPDC059479]|uniref:DUF4232 domain-containing protein n=1 Tax=Streptomyces sp. NPDC059479 TaxID=3346848 RepID=UPI0036923CAF
MARIRRSAVAAVGALALVAVVGGCSDIRNEIDAERRAHPGPSSPPPSPSLSLSSSPAPATPSYPAPADPRPTEEPGPRPWEATGPGPCLASGVSFGHGPVDAAMGHRAVEIELMNCGKKPYRVNGYPEIGVLDEDREPLALKLTHGNAYTDASRDQGPKPLTLAPGESVRSVLHWNNRITDTAAHDSGAYVVVAAAAGEERSTLPLPVDVGTSDELDVTAWATGPAPRPN